MLFFVTPLNANPTKQSDVFDRFVGWGEYIDLQVPREMYTQNSLQGQKSKDFFGKH